MRELESIIEAAWERRATTNAEEAGHLQTQLERVLDGIEAGVLRVADPDGQGGWRVHQWLKKAVLLYFGVTANRVMDGGPMAAFDKIPLRFADAGEQSFRDAGARIVPGALVRRGAFVGKDAVLMPSYVNIGAYVGEGAMVDTWATVGSCAQIG
ncbi:MAG: 2,3,4,5-tetrahydropyridine-2,6-dicarboxylate N-succinyltransferase, partial [Rhodanobacteraceae bacterium]